MTAFLARGLSLSVRHHHRDGVTVSHNTRQSTGKQAIGAKHGGHTIIYWAICSVTEAVYGRDG